jgi:hypothetical protein
MPATTSSGHAPRLAYVSHRKSAASLFDYLVGQQFHRVGDCYTLHTTNVGNVIHITIQRALSASISPPHIPDPSKCSDETSNSRVAYRRSKPADDGQMDDDPPDFIVNGGDQVDTKRQQ